MRQIYFMTKPDYITLFGLGVLPGKMLLTKIIENDKIMLILGQFSLSKV